MVKKITSKINMDKYCNVTKKKKETPIHVDETVIIDPPNNEKPIIIEEDKPIFDNTDDTLIFENEDIEEIPESTTEIIEEPIQDDEQIRKVLINKITQFNQTFPNIQIKKRIPKFIEKAQLDDLKAIQLEQECALKNLNGSNMLMNSFFHLTSVLENVATSNNVDMSGYTEKLKKQQDELQIIFSQLVYEYFDSELIQYFSSPELRLMIILVSTGMSTYTVNQQKQKLIERYKDEPEKLNELMKLLPS